MNLARFRLAVVCLVAACALAPLASLSAADELTQPLAKLNVADGDSIVFLGDSITHQCLYTQYVEDYFLTRFPQHRYRFHNAGVGGDRCADALARFDRDVAHYKPKFVTVLLGMNDGSYQPFNAEVFQTYRAGMAQLIERIEALGATPVLMTPTMYDARAARLGGRPATTPAETHEQYNSVLAYYGAWLREQAVERGLGFVDMYSPLNNLTIEARRRDPKFTLIRDAIHPDAPGQLVMAAAMLMDLGLPRGVSKITISRGTGDEAVTRATGGQVTDARFTSDGLEFTFAAKSLPLALPEEAQVGAKLLHLGHRLSQESLDVHGLAPGTYELLIEGQPVGRYQADALGRHVELQDNPATPQYQQALAVTTLNKQRNDEAVRPLRDLWRDVKILRRTREQLAAQPDNAGLKAQVAKLEQNLGDLEARIAEYEAKSQAILDKIYAANAPRPLKYRLVRVADAAPAK